MTLRWLSITITAFACGIANGQDMPPTGERWRYEGEFRSLASPVAHDEACGEWSAFFTSQGYINVEATSVVLEGLGCALPLGDGSDTTLHRCTDSDQLEAWSQSSDAALLPSLSFQPVQLDRETGAFFLAGEAIHGDEKVCFQTTGTATRVE